MTLILASGSAARRAILRQAGLVFTVQPPDLDESIIKALGQPHAETALALAVAKASLISAQHPAALVIGADQILTCEGERFDKPANPAQAATHLRALRGRTHQLVTAACIVENGRPVWRHIETPTLKMRDFSETFLQSYLAAEADMLTASAGAYRLEGPGSQLFERIEGDFFTILGLPLLPLLAYLRQAGAAPV